MKRKAQAIVPLHGLNHTDFINLQSQTTQMNSILTFKIPQVFNDFLYGSFTIFHNRFCTSLKQFIQEVTIMYYSLAHFFINHCCDAAAAKLIFLFLRSRACAVRLYAVLFWGLCAGISDFENKAARD